jgi:hypothetical protein
MRAHLLVIFFIQTLGILAQDSLNIPHTDFRVNNLGQLQLIDHTGLDLYSVDGKKLNHHSESYLSEMTSLDRTSSLRLLVFYGNVPAFQILDNTVSPHSPVYDLNEEEMGNLSAMCMSTNNTYWAFDQSRTELVRFDENFNLLFTGGNQNNPLVRDLEPIRMIEYEGRLYIADKELGVLIFDQFGYYSRWIDLKGLRDIALYDGQLYLALSDMIQKYDIETRKGEWSNKVPYEIKRMDIEGGRIYLGDRKTIHIKPLDSLFE